MDKVGWVKQKPLLDSASSTHIRLHPKMSPELPRWWIPEIEGRWRYNCPLITVITAGPAVVLEFTETRLIASNSRFTVYVLH